MAVSVEKAAGKAKLQSLECPRCGCRHIYVVETRSTPKRIVRLRQCRHCGRRMMTYEQFAGYAASFSTSAKG